MMVSQEWLDRYFDRHVNHRLVDGDPVLAERIRTHLFRGLKRLNAIPREDPFWRDTNQEPTLFKLSEYCSRQLRTDPQNEELVWIQMSDQLLHCADTYLGDLLGLLLGRDLSNIEWVMAAALWIRDRSGFSAASSLRDLVIEIRTRLPELREKLDQLRRGATAHRLVMIDEVFNLNSEDWSRALKAPGHSA